MNTLVNNLKKSPFENPVKVTKINDYSNKYAY